MNDTPTSTHLSDHKMHTKELDYEILRLENEKLKKELETKIMHLDGAHDNHKEVRFKLEDLLNRACAEARRMEAEITTLRKNVEEIAAAYNRRELYLLKGKNCSYSDLSVDE